MSLSDDILVLLSYYSAPYHVTRTRLYEMRRKTDHAMARSVSEAAMRTTLHRLAKRGLIEKKPDGWVMNITGRKYLVDRIPFVHRNHAPRTDSKKLIIVFDIPEVIRKKRDWLRIELKASGFVMLQQSVWFGPPISSDFADALRKANVLPYLKFFEARKADILGTDQKIPSRRR